VYEYDRRGRGDSGDTPPYAVEREVEDLAALVVATGGSAFVFGSRRRAGACSKGKVTAQRTMSWSPS
jgi:hypothetical protein